MMGVPLSAALLFLLSVGLKEQVVESCTCRPEHLQEIVCRSDTVIRAEITGKTRMPRYINRNGWREIQYDIKVIQVFKGSDKIKNIQHVYTTGIPTFCGVSLAHGQYLLSGSIIFEKFSVSSCNFVVPWNTLSLTLINNLKYRYQMGCNCTISRCTEQRCLFNTKNECILTGRSSSWTPMDTYGHMEPVLEYACIRHSDGSCRWYTGHLETTPRSVSDVRSPRS